MAGRIRDARAGRAGAGGRRRESRSAGQAWAYANIAGAYANIEEIDAARGQYDQRVLGA